MNIHIKPSAPVRKRAARGGFTLLEISIVMIIIAIFTSGALWIGAGKVEEAKRVQTELKLDELEKALQSFRSINGRLPCPADISAAENTANYGNEALIQGRCRGSSPQVNMFAANGWAVAGGIPYKTLGIAEDYTYDGWDRRFQYAVDKRFTETKGFENYDIYYLTPYALVPASCNALQIENPAAAGGGIRSGTAVYALMSHGENLHGAYDRTGTIRKGNGTASADDLQNCHCDANGVPGTYDAIYRIGKFLNNFDDVGRFRERWQMQVQDDKRYLPYVGPEVMVATTGSPFVEFYTRDCEVYLGPFNYGVLPGQSWSTSISPNNRYWAIGHDNAPFVTFFRRTAATGAMTINGAALDSVVEGPARAVAFSPQGQYLAVGGQDTTPPTDTTRLKIYKVTRGSDTFTELVSPDGPNTQPLTDVNALAFSQSDLFLAMGHSQIGTNLTIYRKSNDVFNSAIPTIVGLPSGAVNSVAFSNDNRYLAVGSAGAPYLYVYTYNTTTSVFTKLNDLNFTALPASSVASVSWNQDNRYLAVAVNNGTSSVYVYRLDPAANTFTQVAGPGTAYATTSYGTANAVALSPRQNIIYHGGTAAGPSRFLGRMNFIPTEEVYYFADTAPYIAPTSPTFPVRAISVRNHQGLDN